MKKLSPKRVLWWAGAVVLAVSCIGLVLNLASIFAGNRFPSSKPQAAAQPASSTPTTTSTTELPVPAVPPSKPKRPKNGAAKQAEVVEGAAIDAVTALSNAKLKPLPQLQAAVNRYVPPSLRADALATYVYNGANLTKAMNYLSIDAANLLSEYKSTVYMWKLASLKGNQAVVGLYTLNHMKLSDGNTLDNYEVEFVKMQKYKGHWLWVGFTNPPPNMKPPSDLSNLSSAQEQAVYSQYLQKGRWKSYAKTD